MAMRLLDKKEVDRAKATEQRTKIDEGAKLARQIDALRETRLTEEASLETFRRETVKKVHADIKVAIDKRDKLTSEVEVLKREKAELKKPLDAEWAVVERVQEENRIEREEIRKEKIAARDRDLALDERERELKRKENLSDEREKLTNTRLGEASSNASATATALKEANKVLEDAQARKEQIDAELANREANVLAAERGVTMKGNALDRREKNLGDGWKLLNDRKAAFERRIKRSTK